MSYIVDIEADGLLDTITRVHCIVARDTDTGEFLCYHDDPSVTPCHGSIAQGLSDLQDVEWIGHNIQGYDIPALAKIYSEFATPTRIQDTVVMSRFFYPDGFYEKDCKLFGMIPGLETARKESGEHSLEAWGYRLGVTKGEFGKTSDWSEFTQEMLDYCVQDTAVNLTLWRHLINRPHMPTEALKLEHEFAACLDRQMRRGVSVDIAVLEDLCSRLETDFSKSEQECASIVPPRVEEMKTPQYWEDPDTGDRFITKTSCPDNKVKKRLVRGPNRVKEYPYNPNSRLQTVEFFKQKYGWEPVDFTDKGHAKMDEKVLEALPFEEAPKIQHFMELKKRLGQVVSGEQAWVKHIQGGKIYGRIRHIGTRTHRCSHSRPNLGQVPAVGKSYGSECRRVYRARPGWVMMGCDAQGLEGRVKAHYLQRFDGGAYIQTVLHGSKEDNTDIHGLNCLALGLNPKVKKERDKAKTFYYAWLYGAGDAKLGAIIMDKAPHPSLVPVGKQYRAKLESGVPGLGDLIAGIKWKDKDRRTPRTQLRLIDGCYVPSPFQHAAPNTLFQGTGARIMKRATVNLHELATHAGFVEDQDWGMVLHVHDEFQCECRPEIAEPLGELAVEAIRMVEEQFNFRCALDGEAKIGQSWEDTH